MTAQVRTPCFSIAFATSPRSADLAILRRRGPVEIVDRDVGAELCQPLRHDPSEAAAGARHERDRSAQFPGHSDLSVHAMPSARILAALLRIIAIS